MYKRYSLLHILSSSIAKHLSSPGSVSDAPSLSHHLDRRPSRVLSILEVTLQTASGHLLEAHDEDCIGHAACNHGAAEMQTRGASRAVVVNVVDRDLCHAELVEDSLSAGGVAIAVACNASVDVIVVRLSVYKSFDACLVTQLCLTIIISGWLFLCMGNSPYQYSRPFLWV